MTVSLGKYSKYVKMEELPKSPSTSLAFAFIFEDCRMPYFAKCNRDESHNQLINRIGLIKEYDSLDKNNVKEEEIFESIKNKIITLVRKEISKGS